MELSFLLAPKFLTDNIDVLALLISGFLLVVFDSFVTKEIALTMTDRVKETAHSKIKSYTYKTKYSGLSKYFSEWIATSLFLLYVFFGTTVLAEYVFAPILFKFKEVIVLVCIALFLVANYVMNDKELRKEIMK
jgi:hypothetical protein